MKRLLNDKKETQLLLNNIPAVTVAMFVVSVVCMNLLANKTILQYKYLALDGGFFISWMAFMCMDVITKHYGPKAANTVSFLAAGINLLTSLVFFIVSRIPSNADDYTTLDALFGGTWFILLGSTVAFLASAMINNFLNYAIGKAFKDDPDGKAAFFARTYVSTFIGQFFDNLIFAVIVFMFFAPIFWDGFHWTFLQCFMCAVTGAIAELLMEVLFSPVAYRILQRWKRDHVGQAYLNYVNNKETA